MAADVVDLTLARAVRASRMLREASRTVICPAAATDSVRGQPKAYEVVVRILAPADYTVTVFADTADAACEQAITQVNQGFGCPAVSWGERSPAYVKSARVGEAFERFSRTYRATRALLHWGFGERAADSGH